MTASEKVKQMIVNMATGVRYDDPAVVESVYAGLQEEDGTQDAEGELRPGTHATGLPCEYSRHYESKAVAAQMLDGSWVGWTYWYGGGKHGEPGAVPWIEDAYDVTAKEVVKVVIEFSKSEAVT